MGSTRSGTERGDRSPAASIPPLCQPPLAPAQAKTSPQPSAAGTVPAIPATGSTSQSNTELGWTAGAGFEYMFMPQLTGKIEYLYATTLIFVDSVKFNTSIVRAGVNWKF